MNIGQIQYTNSDCNCGKINNIGNKNNNQYICRKYIKPDKIHKHMVYQIHIKSSEICKYFNTNKTYIIIRK